VAKKKKLLLPLKRPLLLLPLRKLLLPLLRKPRLLLPLMVLLPLLLPLMVLLLLPRLLRHLLPSNSCLRNEGNRPSGRFFYACKKRSSRAIPSASRERGWV